MMRVDNEQEADYWQVEEFWSKLHQQRANNGDIVGWDLWQLQPGGEDQHFQWMTVTLFNDPVKMMEGPTEDGYLMKMLKLAYPNMSTDELEKKLSMTGKSRDLAVRVFLEELASTQPEFAMDLGTVAQIDLMKVEPGQNDAYEKAEMEVFKPSFQQFVNQGFQGSWGLLRVMFPFGSEVYASHITVNMFKDYSQYFKAQAQFDWNAIPEDQRKAMQAGIETRDMKWTYMATLRMKVRKEEG